MFVGKTKVFLCLCDEKLAKFSFSPEDSAVSQNASNNAKRRRKWKVIKLRRYGLNVSLTFFRHKRDGRRRRKLRCWWGEKFLKVVNFKKFFMLPSFFIILTTTSDPQHFPSFFFSRNLPRAGDNSHNRRNYADEKNGIFICENRAMKTFSPLTPFELSFPRTSIFPL